MTEPVRSSAGEGVTRACAGALVEQRVGDERLGPGHVDLRRDGLAERPARLEVVASDERPAVERA